MCLLVQPAYSMPPLTDEQRMIVETIDALAANEFAARAFEWDGEIPWENIELLADNGFLGINLDEEYGGQGMTEYEVLLISETIGRYCPDTARYFASQHMVSPRAIDMFGSDEAKEKYLPALINGESYISIAMSEPEAGSDVKAMNTTVREEGGELILNGEKIWVSEVPDASAAVVWTKFPDGNLGTVILDFDADGVEIANNFTNMAGHTQSQFYINDVSIPEENVLVRGREAFKEQLKSLNWERLGAATTANSFSICALHKALDYAEQREQFGQPIGEFQGIEWKLADMVTKLEASRSLAYQAADAAIEQGRVPDPLRSSIANLYSGVVAEEIVSEALQIHGANGYQQGHPLEYLYRLTRGYRMAGGTDEIIKNTIADFLKKDGVPTVV